MQLFIGRNLSGECFKSWFLRLRNHAVFPVQKSVNKEKCKFILTAKMKKKKKKYTTSVGIIISYI
jgi:hypothetical protein